MPVEQRLFGKPEFCIRPSFLSFVGCTNVLLADFTIGSGPNWTIHPIYCLNTTIRGVKVITDGPNDGIDPDSCRDMLIEIARSTPATIAQCSSPVTTKMAGASVARRKTSSCGIVSANVATAGWSSAARCPAACAMSSWRIVSSRGLIAPSASSHAPDRGGVVGKHYARNLKVKNMQREVAILNMDYGADRNKPIASKPPIFRDMQFENITGDGAPTAILIQGMADSPIENIRFANLTIKSTKGVVANFAKGLVFDNVQVTTADGPVFKLTDAVDTVIKGSVAPKGTELFLQLGGRTSRAVTLELCDLSRAAKKFVVGADLNPEEVQIK